METSWIRSIRLYTSPAAAGAGLAAVADEFSEKREKKQKNDLIQFAKKN